MRNASLILLALAAAAGQGLKYQTPPKALADLVDVMPTPSVLLSPAGVPGAKRWMLIQQYSGLPSIADLAQPELRMAGLRFNPKTNGQSRGANIIGLKLKALPEGEDIAVSGLPQHPKVLYPRWSPDGKKVAFINVSDAPGDAGLSLWLIDVATARARRLGTVAMNAVFGQPCAWLSDSVSLICKTVPSNRGAAPKRSEVPTGPVVQENLGRVTPAATYEDLLKSPEDEQIFDYYATSQLQLIALSGAAKAIGKAGVVTGASPSPDGNYVLVQEYHRPYTYLLPVYYFPERTSVVHLKSGISRQLADIPLQDSIPNIHDSVPAGQREHQWRSDAPAEVVWVEAGDGGDPRKNVPTRDTLYALDAPFDGASRKVVELPVRFSGVYWGTNSLALVTEERWSDRKSILLKIDPGTPQAATTLWEGSFEDQYHHPGYPVTIPNQNGKSVLQTTPDGAGIYLFGQGASPEGDKPFVAVMSATTGASKRVWESAAPSYENPAAMLDTASGTVLIRRESPDQNPNFYVKKIGGEPPKQVTFFPNPYGKTPLPKKQVLKYKRADGVDLSANLYLPPGYKPQDGPLPTLLEAYPTEYKTKDAAGQITGSPYQFAYLGVGSPVPFVMQGYAVLENASIPIVGEGNAEPNDTYVDQLVAAAKAAIDEGARLGVVDRGRVAVMGHSYGAFMTANLLAHSNLFRAGIARSGAYNRTLTPFGFQNEDRTYWQVPDIYNKMSPFMHADSVKTPLLLIHGEADNNPGTFPIQSERFFAALKGHGATVRFVLLPLESHGYAARESLLHMLWEMNQWMETYVRPIKP
jgi:dipeptidyl aminopeptidase/acylaminoacyl peptidase